MSISRLFGIPNDQRREEEFKQRHPGSIIRRDFLPVPMIGGFLRFSVVPDKTPKNQSSDNKPRNKP